MKYLLIIQIVLIGSNGFSQNDCFKNKNKKSYIENINSLTKQSLIVHLVLDVKNSEGKDEKILLSNYVISELISKKFYLDFEFADTLSKILLNNYYSLDYNRISEYKISESFYNKMIKIRPCKILKKYFDSKGLSKSKKYSSEEIRAAVTYLIESYFFVFQDQFSIYSVNIDSCCSNKFFWRKQ